MTDQNTAPPAPSVWRRIARIVGVIELTIGIICLLTILVLVFFQALQRYLPIDQVPWTGEVAGFAMAWLTFSAMGLLVTMRGHISLEIIDSMRHQPTLRFFQVLALVIVAIVALGLMFEAISLINSQQIIKASATKIPLSYVYIPVLIGTISTVIRSLVAATDIALHGPVAASYDEDQAEVVS